MNTENTDKQSQFNGSIPVSEWNKLDGSTQAPKRPNRKRKKRRKKPNGAMEINGRPSFPFTKEVRIGGGDPNTVPNIECIGENMEHVFHKQIVKPKNMEFTSSVTIVSTVHWSSRLWNLIKNPFTYLFYGKITY